MMWLVIFQWCFCALDHPLDRYRAHLDTLRCCSFDYEGQLFVVQTQRPTLPADQPEMVFRASVHFSRPTLRMSDHVRSQFLDPTGSGEFIRSESAGEILWMPEFGLTVGLDEQAGRLRFVVLTPRDLSEPALKVPLVHPEVLLPMVGVLRHNGGVSLLEILERTDPAKIKVDAAGHGLVAETDYGVLTMELDPAHGNAPKSISLVKTGDSLVNPKETLSNPDTSYRHSFWGKGPPVSITMKVEVRDYVVQGTATIPSAFIVSESIISKEGEVEACRYECKLTEFALGHTEKSLTLLTPIPNGTPVTVKGAEQIQHIWLDGKVVKVVDQSVVADLSGQRFQQSRAYWTVLAVLGLFVLVLGTVYLYVRRRGPSAVA